MLSELVNFNTRPQRNCPTGLKPPGLRIEVTRPTCCAPCTFWEIFSTLRRTRSSKIRLYSARNGSTVTLLKSSIVLRLRRDKVCLLDPTNRVYGRTSILVYVIDF